VWKQNDIDYKESKTFFLQQQKKKTTKYLTPRFDPEKLRFQEKKERE
jgi:hypothetical protein